MQISQKIEFSKVEESNQFLLTLNSRALYVSELVYVIIREMVKGADVAAITRVVNEGKHFSRPLAEADISRIIAAKIAPLDLSDGAVSEHLPQTIHFQFILLRYRQVRKVLEAIAFLYRPVLFWPLLIVSAALSLAHIILSPAAPADFALPPGYYLLSMVIMLAISLAHELGHAGAAAANKIVPGEIGVGLYLFFPVFFANVNSVWGLAPAQRIVVNLAGIYNQLILNVGLSAACLVVDDPLVAGLFRQVIVVNLLTILTNLNPFFKFDGYWVFSDFFGLPNLKQTVMSLLWSMLRRVRGQGSPASAPRTPLLVYSVAYVLFFAWVWYSVVHFLAAMGQEIWSIVAHGVSIATYNHPYLPAALRYTITLFLICHILSDPIKRLAGMAVARFKAVGAA